MISSVFKTKSRNQSRAMRNNRDILKATLTVPIQIRSLQIFTSPNWILEDKGWLCAIRAARDASNEELVNSSWPYSRIVDAPYQYFTGSEGEPSRTMEAAIFARPVHQVEFELIQWRKTGDGIPAPSRVAWLGKTSDGIKLAGWVNVE